MRRICDRIAVRSCRLPGTEASYHSQRVSPHLSRVLCCLADCGSFAEPRIALCIDGGRLLPLTERSVPLSVHAYEAGGFPEWDNIFAEKHLRIMDLKSAVEINALFSRFRSEWSILSAPYRDELHPDELHHFQALRRLDLLQPRLKSVSTVHVPSNIKVIIERFRFPPGVAFSFPDLHLENKPHELHCDIWIITPRLRAMERLSLIIKSGQFTIIGLHIELFYHGLEQNWDEVSPLRVALSSATTVTTMSLNFDILLYKFEHLPYSLKTLHVDCDHYEETYLPTNNDHPRHPRTDSLTRWIDADNWGKRNSLNLEHLIIRSQSADPLEKNDGCQQLMKSCKARGIMMTFRPQLEVLGCRFPALTSNYDNYGLPKSALIPYP